MVATNLSHLADHADLTDIVESLKSPQHAGCDTLEASPESISEPCKSESDVEIDRLLAQLVEPAPPPVEDGT